MVNGVLVERTVQDVLPTLKTNSDGLKQVLEELLKQYKAKQTELDTWKVSGLLIYWSMSDGKGEIERDINANWPESTEKEQYSGRTTLNADSICISDSLSFSTPVLLMLRITLPGD
jgi:hypothetical protein